MSDYKIYNCDCIEFMQDMVNQEKKVDCIITDPPYLTTDLEFDKKFNSKCFNLIKKILKKNSYFISFGSLELHSLIIQNDFIVRFSGVWIKPAGVMRTHSAKKPMSRQEIFSVYCKKGYNIKDIVFNKIKENGTPYKKIMKNTGYKREGNDCLSRLNAGGFTKDGYELNNNGFRMITDTIFAPNKNRMKFLERTEHPTQKPISLMEKIILMLTNENETILDPFMGSGSTGLACLFKNRNFIGCEIDKEYFEIAERRLKSTQDTLKQSLFYGMEI